MMKSGTLQNGLLAIAAVALIGLLAFLYYKTQTVDLKEQNEVLSLLRELKDIDVRWDADVASASLHPDSTAMAPVDRRAASERVLRALAEAGNRAAGRTLQASLPDLSKAVREKALLVEAFQAENSASKKLLEEVVAESTDIGTQLGQLKARLLGAEASLSRLATTAPLFYWLAQESQASAMTSALSEVDAAKGIPEALLARMAGLREAVNALVTHKAAEKEIEKKIASLTSRLPLEKLMQSVNRDVETTAQGAEVYRVYLIAYAAALLIVLAWLGAKLKAANVSLEHRVQERTRELSDALMHLKESEAQLIQSEKMSSLGQMVAGVAHEINTPLAYVKNSLGTVAGKLPDLGTALDESSRLLTLLQAGSNADPAELTKQFSLVSQHLARLKERGVVEELAGLVNDGVYGTGQMAEIVGNLKDFSRLDRSKVTSFNLNEGLASTLLLAKHLLKSVQVERRFGDIPAIVCSPSQINQVFLNLITNAAQAMEGGKGTITLTTRKEGDGAVVEVLDTGKGIPAEVMPKIFDPFFSTKEIGKGTGLGLSISYKIVQQHGGRIAVESQLGRGTKFTVVLPARPPADAVLAA
ncbi:MAG TPA: ATP-binding protein [Burkholderiales bacterium]|nr:ATP-binding protein [Burkholderiales bacterium]